MHARCPISMVFGHYGCFARPPSCRPSWLDPGDPPDDLGSRSLFPLTWYPCPSIHLCWGKQARTWVPTIHQTLKYSFWVEMLLTPISHPILNQPAMATDTCGFLIACEGSLHSAKKDTPILCKLCKQVFVFLSLNTKNSMFHIFLSFRVFVWLHGICLSAWFICLPSVKLQGLGHHSLTTKDLFP